MGAVADMDVNNLAVLRAVARMEVLAEMTPEDVEQAIGIAYRINATLDKCLLCRGMGWRHDTDCTWLAFREIVASVVHAPEVQSANLDEVEK